MYPNTTQTHTSQVDVSKLKIIPSFTALIVGAFVSLLNETLLGNALAVLVEALQVSYATTQWLTTGYMLVVGVLVPVTAILQQSLTSRQMFLASVDRFFIAAIL